MKYPIRRTIAAAVAAVGAFALAGCASDADVASKNLSKDADNFKILRQVVLYNGITDKYIVSVEGFCSLGNSDGPGQVSVTCKVGEKYIKDIFMRSDNTLVFEQQLNATNVSVDHYKVIFKPTTVIPDFEAR